MHNIQAFEMGSPERGLIYTVCSPDISDVMKIQL